MSHNTRDIAIRTEAKVEQLNGHVETLLVKVANMENALAERRGAERVARWMIGLGSGTLAGSISAFFAKFGTAFFQAPLPK